MTDEPVKGDRDFLRGQADGEQPQVGHHVREAADGGEEIQREAQHAATDAGRKVAAGLFAKQHDA